jgi:hypothetical protein
MTIVLPSRSCFVSGLCSLGIAQRRATVVFANCAENGGRITEEEQIDWLEQPIFCYFNFHAFCHRLQRYFEV